MATFELTAETDVLRVHYRGRADHADVRALTAAMRPLLAAQTTRFIVVDTSEVAGFTTAAREAGREWATMIRGAGVELLIGVVPMTLLRMTASTICLATRQPVRLFATAYEAEAALAQLLMTSPVAARSPRRAG